MKANIAIADATTAVTAYFGLGTPHHSILLNVGWNEVQAEMVHVGGALLLAFITHVCTKIASKIYKRMFGIDRRATIEKNRGNNPKT